MTTMSLFPDLPDDCSEWVYYATDGYNIKIGTTTDVDRRGGQLKVTMLLKFRGGVFEERRHQRIWRAYRIDDTEWFRPRDELLLWITTQLEPRSRELAALQAIIRRANATRRAA